MYCLPYWTRALQYGFASHSGVAVTFFLAAALFHLLTACTRQGGTLPAVISHPLHNSNCSSSSESGTEGAARGSVGTEGALKGSGAEGAARGSVGRIHWSSKAGVHSSGMKNEQ